jgi:hypothetical protein
MGCLAALFVDCNPGGNIFHLAVLLYQVNINFSRFDVGRPKVMGQWMSWVVDGLGWLVTEESGERNVHIKNRVV